MRPVTVSVGPLAAASANNICTTQTPNAGTALVLNGTLASNSFQGTGSITANVLTISAVTSGVLNIGMSVGGSQVLANTVVIGLGPNTTNGIGTYVLNVSQSVSSTTIYGSAIATLDKPRRVLLTPSGNESANTFTISGTDTNFQPITEVLTGGNGAATYSAMDYRTVTQIVATNTAAASLTVGTNGVASSMWVSYDDYAPAPNSIQVTVTGTVNYTIEHTIQSESLGLLPYQLTWIGAGVISGTTSQITSFPYTPLRARVTLNSGSGSFVATMIQNASVPY